MAGRPFTGSARTNADGSVTVRIPVAPGSTEKITARFANEQLKERWLAAVAAARRAGQPLPDPARFKVANKTKDAAPASEGFSDVAWYWWDKYYVARQTTGPSRADAVANVIRLHLEPFFSPRVDSIQDITYADCEEWIEHMAGIRRERPAATSVVVAEHRLLTISEAVEWSGSKRSTIMKAWLAKRFPGAYNDLSAGKKGTVRIPIGDLIAAGYTPKNHQPAEVPFGYAVSVVDGHLNVLRRIFKFAISHGMMTHDPSATLAPLPPLIGTKSKAPPKDDGSNWLNLVASKKIADRMHIHHQLAFWIMRLTGERIGETYGITLGDIHREDEHMALMLRHQGGKRQKVRDKTGTTVTVTLKEGMKSEAGRRYIPVPKALGELIDLYVEAFHSPDAGPMTPLIRTPRGLGQSAYRDAMKGAVGDAGFGYEAFGIDVIPKFLRVCLVCDLTPVEKRLRSIYVGHKVTNYQGGAPVTEDKYTRRRAGIDHLLPVTDFLDELIAIEIGTLVEPAPLIRLVPDHRNMDPVALSQVVDVLDEAGLLGDEVVDGEVVISNFEAAQILAISERQVRELSKQGHLERQRIRKAGKESIYGVTAASVKARLEIDQDLWSRQRICDELSLTYVELRRLLRHLDVKPINSAGTLGERYRNDEVELLRSHLKNLTEQRQRSASVQQVADELGCTRQTVHRFIAMGKLTLDQDATDNLKMTMVTRESIDTVIAKRQNRASLPYVRPAGSFPIAEAEARTGLTRVQVLELAKHGVTIHRTPDFQFHVDEATLELHLRTNL
jgi:integrase